MLGGSARRACPHGVPWRAGCVLSLWCVSVCVDIYIYSVGDEVVAGILWCRCLSLSLSVSVAVCLPRLSGCLCMSLYVCLCMSVCMSAPSLSLSLSLCVSRCLSLRLPSLCVSACLPLSLLPSSSPSPLRDTNKHSANVGCCELYVRWSGRSHSAYRINQLINHDIQDIRGEAPTGIYCSAKPGPSQHYIRSPCATQHRIQNPPP